MSTLSCMRKIESGRTKRSQVQGKNTVPCIKTWERSEVYIYERHVRRRSPENLCHWSNRGYYRFFLACWVTMCWRLFCICLGHASVLTHHLTSLHTIRPAQGYRATTRSLHHSVQLTTIPHLTSPRPALRNGSWFCANDARVPSQKSP